MASPRSAYSAALRLTLRNTAAAYGYALTLAPTMALLGSIHGRPHEAQVFLFAAGGVLAFAALEVAMLAFADRDGDTPEHAFPFAGALNVLSVLAGLGTATGVAHAFSGGFAWFLAPLAATAVYMLVVACQVTLVDVLRQRSG